MPWPTDEAVKKGYRSGFSDVTQDEVAAILRAVGLPEFMGTAEAAAEYGVATGNLSKIPTLPDPVAELKMGRLWLADDIRRDAAERRAR